MADLQRGGRVLYFKNRSRSVAASWKLVTEWVHPLIYLNRHNLRSLLVGNGIKFLYHTNTVTTSRSYLIAGQMLSRQQCVARSLDQSGQYTDAKDQAHGMWNRLFLNVRNSHDQYSGVSLFGPIRFVVSVQKLFDHLEEQLGNIGITETNVERWTSNHEGRWFTQVPQFTKIWLARHDFVIDVSNGSLPLELIERIEIDPHPDEAEWAGRAAQLLTDARTGNNPTILIYECKKIGCGCPNWPSSSSQRSLLETKFTLPNSA